LFLTNKNVKHQHPETLSVLLEKQFGSLFDATNRELILRDHNCPADNTSYFTVQKDLVRMQLCRTANVQNHQEGKLAQQPQFTRSTSLADNPSEAIR